MLNRTGVMGMIVSGRRGYTNAVCNDTISSVLKDYLGCAPGVRTICVLFISTYANHCVLTIVFICFLLSLEPAYFRGVDFTDSVIWTYQRATATRHHEPFGLNILSFSAHEPKFVILI